MNTTFYTGAGDSGAVKVGETALPKSAPLFDTLGRLDAVNSYLGWAKVAATAHPKGEIDIAKAITNVQQLLFIAQAEVASHGYGNIPKVPIIRDHVTYLETVIKEVDAILPSLKTFVLSGGTELGARLDIARTESRTLERSAVRASREGTQQLSPELLAFMNRLSSICFALARYANHTAGYTEQPPTYMLEA